MRRFWHLALLPVLLSAFSASFSSNAKDVFTNKTIPYISKANVLQSNKDVFPFLEVQRIPRSSEIPNKLNCDFNAKNCTWDGLLNWSWVKYSYNQVKKDAPIYNANDDSKYSLQVNFTAANSKITSLKSPEFSVSNVACFTFSYYFVVDTTKQSFLEIVLDDQSNGKSTSIWVTAGLNEDNWGQGEAQIDQSGKFKIKIIALGSLGFIAVKNFQLTYKKCPTNKCTFESGDCGYTVSNGVGTFITAVSWATDGVIKFDHTSHSENGHFKLAKIPTQGSTASLVSPAMSNLRVQCLTFFFYRSGMGMNLRLFKHHITTGYYDTALWQSNETHLVGEWIRVQQDLIITDNINLVFEAKKIDTSSSLAIDDISLKPFECDLPITCEFKTGFCGWKDETKKSTLLWSLGIGRVNDPDKLKYDTPFVTRDGVLYTDFTKISLGSTASMELLSEFVNVPKVAGACVIMSYNVRTISLNTDSFQLTQIDVSGNRNVFWIFNSTMKLNNWNSATIYIPKNSNNLPYRFSILAKSANAATSIAVYTFFYSEKLDLCGLGGETEKPTTVQTTTLSPVKTLNCDFEKGNTCNWKTSTFTVTSPGETTVNTMFFPFNDITLQSRYGKVAYVWSANRNYPTTGVMYADNPYPNAKVCFGFYYYFYSNGPSSFVLQMEKNDQARSTVKVPIFRGFGANEDVWRKAYMTVTPNATFSTFAFRTSLQNGILVLDNISVRPGDCYDSELGNGNMTCDFEQNQSCLLEPYFTPGSATWKVLRAYDEAIDDHTTRSRDGHYYGLDLTDAFGHKKGSTQKQALVLSRRVNGSHFQCLQFSYMLAHTLPTTRLSVVMTAGIGFGKRRESWEVAGSTLKLWFTRIVSTPNENFDLVMIIQTLGEPGGKVFVDDIKFLTTPCNKPNNCDFENGNICNLGMVSLTQKELSATKSAFLASTNVGTPMTVDYLTDFADRIWHVFTPRQSSAYHQEDNTLRNRFGHYLLLTATFASDRGIMITERYNLQDNGGRVCLSFAVFKPSQQSVLEIYQGESFNETHGTKIWDLTRLTRDWETFEILAYPFSNNSVDLFFYIVGTLDDKATYIGLDDIFLKSTCSHPSNNVPTSTLPPGVTTPTPSPNNLKIFTCRNGKIISSSLTCNYVNDCTDGSDENNDVCGSCSFSNSDNWCRYTQQSVLGDFAFRFRSTVNVGPLRGSDGNGNFLVASGHAGSTYFSSPTIHQSYLFCTFEFNYYYSSNELHNNDYSTAMKLYIEMTDSGRRVLIWESAFESLPKDRWRRVTIPIRRVTHSFNLMFYSHQEGSTSTKVHAIDYVSLQKCQPVKPSSRCASDYFHCANQVCVLNRYLCDFEDDCGDGSDEKGCPTNSLTSFESGTGLWGKGIYKNWRVTRTSYFNDLRVGPTYDHTTDYQEYGSVLYVNAHTYNSQNVTVVAEIDSPPFKYTTNNCQIHFYVYKNSADSSLLVVLQNIITGQKYELKEIEDFDYHWVLYTSTMYRYSTDPSAMYRVILTATLKASQSSFSQPYVAIDDISFSPYCMIHTGHVVLPTLPNHSIMTTPKPDGCPTISCLSPNGTKICLQATQFCDFHEDCKDGSDELYCGDCKFEGTMCEWKNFETVNPWTVIQPASSSPGSLPKKDADERATGGYVSVKKIPGSSTFAYSRLQSPRINGHTAYTCKLHFSYYSAHGGSFYVRRLVSGSYTTLLTFQSSAYNWKSYEIDIGVNTPGFNIEFLARTANTIINLYKDVAIDNVKFVNCNPYINNPTQAPSSSNSLNCTFEENLCGWTITGPNQRSNWLRTSSSTNEPGNDHTSLQYPLPPKHGTWMSTQSRSASLVPDVDYLISTQKLKNGQTYCLSFWLYFMTITRKSNFGLYTTKTGKMPAPFSTGNDYIPVFKTYFPFSRNWNQQFVEISPQTDDFYLLFIATVDSSGIVGLDDTVLTLGNCPTVSTTFCDMEVNTCDWKLQQQNGAFKRNTATSSIPDHTTRTASGHFLADIGTSALMTKQLSNLPIFNNSHSSTGSQPFCLQLYYYISTDADMADNSSMFSIKINQGTGVTGTKTITIMDTYNDGLLKTWSLFQYSFYGYKTGSIEISGQQTKPNTKMLLDDISVIHRSCEPIGSCDFESGDTCGWENEMSASLGNKVLWLKIQPNSQFIKGLFLHYDHTTSSKNGNYLVMPAQMQADAYSVLRSPQMYGKGYPHICFSMYYFARGVNSSVIALTVRLIDLGKKTNYAKTINATTSIHWQKVELQFDQSSTTFVFQIEGLYTSGILSDIGVDDVSIRQGICSAGTLRTTTTPVPPSEKQLDCTFESGSQCNWKFDQNAWKLGKFSDMQNNYAPPRDHTSETANGRYLMFQSNSPTSVGHSFNVHTTVNLTYDKDHCLTVWYYEDGEGNLFNFGVYRVFPKFSAVATDFTSAIENRRRWNLLKVDIQYISTYKTNSIGLQIRYTPSANRQNRLFSIFALDDIKVRPGKCNHFHDYVYTLSSLEDLELEYIQPLTNAIGQLYTPAYDGLDGVPSVDHTTETNSGTYFLFKNKYTLAPTVYRDTLSMTGIPPDPFFPVTCIRFAYQVKGNATLKVFVAPNNEFSNFYQSTTPLWQSKYSKNDWTIGEINKQATFEHKVVFYMEKLPDKTSFVALDDIALLSHQCQIPIDCDFEGGRICSYSPLLSHKTGSAQFNWGLFTAPPQDKQWSGPAYDHTTKNYGGGYLYLSAFRSLTAFNQPITAKIVSGPRSVDHSKSYCLSLYMRMTTNDLSLKLSITRYGPYWSDNNRTQTIASKANSAQADWTLLAITVDQTVLSGNTDEIQLVIEGTLATGSKGLIALDDIRMVSGGACQRTNNLVCEDGTPFTAAQICNFVKDCPSGLDELNCGTIKVCDFDKGDTCGWGNMSSSRQKWSLTNAHESNNQFAPKFDGDANQAGHYLMVSHSTANTGTASNAEMALNYATPRMYLKNAYQTCVMQFDYYIRATNKDTYNYYLAVRIGRDQSNWATVYNIARVWSLSGWSKAYAHIGERNSQFSADIFGHLDNSDTSWRHGSSG